MKRGKCEPFSRGAPLIKNRPTDEVAAVERENRKNGREEKRHHIFAHQNGLNF